MVFTLEKPFVDLYKRAYLREDSKGRKRLDLVNSNKDRTTIAYARYLKCVELGYILSSDYEVDHIDGDCSNDSLDNLQVLTKEDHLVKSACEMSTGRTKGLFTCACCGKEFERELRSVRYEKQLCSRSCNGKLSNNLVTKALNEEDVKFIKSNFIKKHKMFGITGLAKILGVSRSTVAKALYDPNY